MPTGTCGVATLHASRDLDQEAHPCECVHCEGACDCEPSAEEVAESPPTIPDYSSEVVPQDPTAMQRLGKLCLRAAELEVELAATQARVKELERERDLYADDLIPAVMAELEMTSLSTRSGLEIEISDDLFVSFPKDEAKRREAFAYLREVGSDGIIKQEISLTFDRGTDAEAGQLWRQLQAMGLSADLSRQETVHHGTLKRFIQDERERGANIPLQAFGAFVKTRAHVRLRR